MSVFRIYTKILTPGYIFAYPISASFRLILPHFFFLFFVEHPGNNSYIRLKNYIEMDAPKSYCEFVEKLPTDNLHRLYHDTAYGFPIDDDNELFERLILEINQAGLSWSTILNKQLNFKVAYNHFNIEKVAAYNGADIERLLNDAGIIRNRLKINAAIHNANRILELQKEHGSFKNWLDANHPKSKDEWTKLFKKTFTFTGGEIVNEFLLSTGYLKGSHIESCEIYHKVSERIPAWILK